MRKLISYLPLIMTVIGAVYGVFDPQIYAWLEAHSLIATIGVVLLVSETLAATELVKANSVMQAVFDLVIGILKLVLRRKSTIKPNSFT